MNESTESPKRGPGRIQRRAVDLSQFRPVRESQLTEDQPLPLVMTPSVEQVDLADWASNNREYIDQQLHLHGGILFRGFNVATPAAFERVAAATCKQLFGDYGDLPREGVGGKVYSSTPYPEDKSILYHNEASHMNRWPARISFFCMLAARDGGCSPIVDCRRVYQQIDPAVRNAFENKGLMYVRNFCEGLDVSWRNFFQTDDPGVVEEHCRRHGASCEWVGKDRLRTRQRCRGVLRHPRTGEMSFFNQVQLHHVRCLDTDVRESLLSIFKPEDLPRHVYYGDGTPIEDAVIDHIGAVYESNAVRFPWREGDLVTLDNMLTAHGRDPYVGPRKLVVALGDIVNSADVDQMAGGAPA
jgi:alpha-ketoglutarate-dependent taurine dioxygenase